MNMYAVSSSRPATFLIQSIGNVFTSINAPRQTARPGRHCFRSCVQQLDALKLNGKSLFRLDSGNENFPCFGQNLRQQKRHSLGD